MKDDVERGLAGRAPGRSVGHKEAHFVDLGGPHPLGGSADVPVGRGALVPSPCIDVCRMHAATGWCEGCLRTLDEIAAWSGLSNDEKRAVLAQLPARRTAR